MRLSVPVAVAVAVAVAVVVSVAVRVVGLSAATTLLSGPKEFDQRSQTTLRWAHLELVSATTHPKKATRYR